MLAELEAQNCERGFPMVGPEVGSALRLLARLIDADNRMMLTARLNRGVLGYTLGHEPGTAIAR